ncbi:MAG: TrkA family potassium uptake protein [Candidatus Nanohaloarchaea archaeon]|nr:TrkA family potassium uptake protein [Candidatus Nanohaloarchaea archaeon]
MYVIVAGINTISRRLIDDLEKNHDLVVVEEDETKAEYVYSKSGATVIQGSPTRLSVLEDAGISKADVLVSTLEEENENLVVSMLGKKYGVPKVVARVEDTDYLDIYNMLEVNTIEYTDIVYAEFISVIEHPSIRKIANVGTNKEIIEILVGEGSKLKNLRIDEVEALKHFPAKDLEFSAVLRDGEVHDPDATFRLKQGDSVIVIVNPEAKGPLNDVLE